MFMQIGTVVVQHHVKQLWVLQKEQQVRFVTQQHVKNGETNLFLVDTHVAIHPHLFQPLAALQMEVAFSQAIFE